MSQDQARRTGMIARKVGMTTIFDADGRALAVTLLDVSGNVVVGAKTRAKDGYSAVVMGFGSTKPSRVSKSVVGQCAKGGLDPVKVIKEFRVSEGALLDVGAKLAVDHFGIRQFVDIHGVNIGKGFAGPMKRWNFRGLEASHGVSISHRSHGSTGQRQDPGKTFKGKKMAGHMGAESVTVQNLQIAFIDEEFGLVAVHGSVPGKKGSYLTITDAIKMSLPANVQFPAALVVGVAQEKEQEAKEAAQETVQEKGE